MNVGFADAHQGYGEVEVRPAEKADQKVDVEVV